jgi:tetratricopeptide (TPR) repeat protein
VLLGLLVAAAAILTGAGVVGWAEYHLWQARAAAARQHFAEAHQHFSEALRVWRGGASIHLEAARAARRAGMLAQAEQHLETCQRLQGSVSDGVRLERLLLRAIDGEIAEVQLDLWRSVEEDHPGKVAILEALIQGTMQVAVSNTGRAAIVRLLEIQPDNIVGLHWRGVLREHTEEDDEAIADFRAVLEILPEHEEARKHLADLLVKSDPREALEHVALLRQRRPRDAALLLSQAACLKALGQPEDAAKALDEILVDNSNHIGALVQRGLLEVQNGQAAAGEKWLRKAITLQPSHEDAHYHLYQCLLQQPGRTEEARRQYAEWKRVQADVARFNQLAVKQMDQTMRDPALLHELGVILLRNQEEEMALRLFQTALEIQPDYEAAHRTLAEYYRARGKDELAEQHRKQIRSADQPAAQARE